MSDLIPVDPAPARIECRADDGFSAFMAGLGGSLAVTTYQAGKVVFVGWDGRQVTVLPRDFPKPMGLAVEPPAPGRPARLALATRNDLVILADAPGLAPAFVPGQTGPYDALFLPRASYHTADLHLHDVGFLPDGRPVVCATRFSCLAVVSDRWAIEPLWRPPFVSDLTPDDRCHLNGLAMVGGRPGFVTCLGATDVPGGWRADKAAGGVVVEVGSGQVVCRGLAMPHSPRWHGGRLWVLDSGAGELCIVDPGAGRREAVCRLPGYLRGLAFAGRYALVGLCQVREKHVFGGLPVQSRNKELVCGVAAIDLGTGRESGRLTFAGGCTEVFEVAVLPWCRRPNIVGLGRPEARQAVALPLYGYWLRAGDVLGDGKCQGP